MHWFALGLAFILALAVIAIGTQYVACPYGGAYGLNGHSTDDRWPLKWFMLFRFGSSLPVSSVQAFLTRSARLRHETISLGGVTRAGGAVLPADWR